MKISVIIPCFNCANTIENTLKSIIAQTYHDYEIIAVDDGSKDNTAQVLGKYQGKITYIYQDNGGVSKARNTGVRIARGEWIAFCDSDDVWVPEKLEIATEVIEKYLNECSVVFSDYSIMHHGKIIEYRGMMSKETMFPIFKEYNLDIKTIFSNRQLIKWESPYAPIKEFTIYYGNIFKWLIFGNIILPSSALVKKEIYEREHGFIPEFRNAEDTEFFLRLGKIYNYLYIDYPLIAYSRAATSLLATCMLKTIESGIRAVEINCRENEETYQHYKKRVDASLARKYSKLGYFHLSELNRGSAFKSAISSLKYKKNELLAWKVICGSMVPKIVLNEIRKQKISSIVTNV